MTVRPATVDDVTGILGVLDAAALETDADRVRARVECGDAFVAVRDETGVGSDGGTVLGALVLVDREDPGSAEIDAVAVRRRRRGQGIGRGLVAAAADRYDRVVAEFDPKVRPFYESLAFEIEPIDGERDRYRGVSDGTVRQNGG
ncbi:GNAT family N-acetyltransferase [Halosimplex pelagicum]|uniref:GNAT family N-acetyltransferase n=1 Tax=Halosimplex pelagicum TaxID=869886 RepID=A0A7D5PDT9_9EURY|nr:GNAT family N-acetyltransferase [Halosimplex pelagicum]QLH84865.1 GNAT family N-acetyltransferase [Halosimplex pelagicum]